MRSALKTAAAFAAGIAGMLLLDSLSLRRSRRLGQGRRRSGAQALLDIVRPAPVADDTLEARVRRKLARTAIAPEGITVSIEHGCVELRGAVATRERANLVRALAAVKGVDSIMDLMTEPPATTGTARARARAGAAHPSTGRARGWGIAVVGLLLVGGGSRLGTRPRP